MYGSHEFCRRVPDEQVEAGLGNREEGQILKLTVDECWGRRRESGRDPTGMWTPPL